MIALREMIPPSIELYDEDQPIVPRRIGFCSNPISLIQICARPVDDQDVEAVELPPKGNRRRFVCAPCVEKLLTLQPAIPEPKETKPPRYRRTTGSGQTSPRLPKGEDL